MWYFINSPMAPLARKAKERNMARRQTPAQRRASLKNLAKARRARGHGRKRRRNPPPRGVRTAVWRKRPTKRRKYSYSAKHSHRVVRTNPRRHRRRYRRNPSLRSFFSMAQVKDTAVMLGGFYVGRGITNTAVKYIPVPTTGIMGIAVRVGVAIAQSMLVGKFLGPKWGQMAFIGGITTAADPYVKNLPVVGAAIGEDLGSYMAIGEYYSVGELPLGESLPVGEDIAVGEYQYS